MTDSRNTVRISFRVIVMVCYHECCRKIVMKPSSPIPFEVRDI